MWSPAWADRERLSAGRCLLGASVLFWVSFAVFEGLRSRYLYQPLGFRQVLVSLVFYAGFAVAMAAVAALTMCLIPRLRASWTARPVVLLFALNAVVLLILISRADGSRSSLEGFSWVAAGVAVLVGAVALGAIANQTNGKVEVLLTVLVPGVIVWLTFPSVRTQLVELDPAWFLVMIGVGFAALWRSPRLAAPSGYGLALLLPLLILVATSCHILYAGKVGHAPEQFVSDGGTENDGVQRQPDVLMIVLDTVRADHIGSYGYERPVSPHLDQLAALSDRYEYAYATHTRTPESHRSLFTGRFAKHAEATTIAEELRSLGYSTIALSANRLALPADMHRGFDRIAPGVHNLPRAHHASTVRALLAPIPFLGERNWFNNRWVIGDVFYSRATAMVDRAVSWLDASDRPTFLFLNLLDAHDPYRPPLQFAELFPGYDPMLRYDSGLVVEGMRTGRYTSAQTSHVVSQYDGEIAYADAELGRLFSYLRRAGRFEPSLVLVTSDHGEGLGAHGFATHGWFPYEEQSRVPLIVKHPGQDAGRTIGGLWSLVEVKSIVLDSVNGGESSSARDGDDVVLLNGRELLGVRKGPWKLLADKLNGRLRELYDLSRDPGEETDLLAGSTTNEVANRLAAEGFAAADAAGLLKQGSAPSKQQRELLRSLGYIQ